MPVASSFTKAFAVLIGFVKIVPILLLLWLLAAGLLLIGAIQKQRRPPDATGDHRC